MKFLFPVILIFFFCTTGWCQPVQVGDLDKLVVKDSSGVVYKSEDWKALLVTGQYTLRIAADKKNATLVKLSEADASRFMSQIPALSPSPYFKTGEKIQSFSDRDITGTRWDLKKMQGKVVVLNFWFINCPPCRMEIPELNKLVSSYKDNMDVVFLAVALDGRSDIREFLTSMPFEYHIISDGRPIAGQYGINSYPTNVVIDKQGKVSFHTTAYSTRTVAAIKGAIDEALAKMYY